MANIVHYGDANKRALYCIVLYWTSKTRGFQSVCLSFWSPCGPSPILCRESLHSSACCLGDIRTQRVQLLQLWSNSNTSCVVCRIQIFIVTDQSINKSINQSIYSFKEQDKKTHGALTIDQNT